MLPISRRTFTGGFAATAAIVPHGTLCLSTLTDNADSALSVVPHGTPFPTLADMIAERRRLSDTWTRDDFNTADDVVEILYGEPMDALENRITRYQPRDIGEAVQAIDFILAEADNGLCNLGDIRLGGWGADLYRLLEASRNAIGGVA